MATADSVLLGSGMVATIERDRWHPGRYELVVDGTPQSSVDLDDPTQLGFEYIERIGHVIDLLAEPAEPITALHLGAGALTLPRYVAVTRPGSRQQVVELERDLVDLVRERLPLPQGANIRIRYGDARDVVGRLPEGLHGAVDLAVVDIFAGARIPPQVTTREFYGRVASLLSPDGVMAVNVADGAGLQFARTQMATVHAVLPELAVLAEAQVLKGRRFGNLVLVASRRTQPLDWLPRLLAAGPHPAQAVSGDDLRRLIGGAAVVTDETATGSPEPDRAMFLDR
ncbi:spermidine synthase [uncultured Amnibacterium sp.]|uniref:spermidine synthase n=1 Tax=uncultured Amnibacterium sp. TaxID=1631851 RepID=UPI0035CBFC63